jgi:RNA polymerase sigma-70 factor (ECF subfamily)
MEMSLEKYVNLYKSGNDKAFDYIYKETLPLVRVAIYRYIQNRNVIEDLIQDTYMKVARGIKIYDSKNFKNWIYTIAKNTTLDYIKKKKEIISDNLDYVSTGSNPYLNYALNHLDDNLKEVFLLKVLCGHTTKKIAEALNFKPQEVNQMYYQAKNELKRCLKEEQDELK